MTKKEIKTVIAKIHNYEAWEDEAKRTGNIREEEACSLMANTLANLLSEFGYGHELAQSYKQ